MGIVLWDVCYELAALLVHSTFPYAEGVALYFHDLRFDELSIPLPLRM